LNVSILGLKDSVDNLLNMLESFQKLEQISHLLHSKSVLITKGLSLDSLCLLETHKDCVKIDGRGNLLIDDKSVPWDRKFI